MGKYIIAFGRAWVCTLQAYNEIQAILISIYSAKVKGDGNGLHGKDLSSD